MKIGVSGHLSCEEVYNAYEEQHDFMYISKTIAAINDNGLM